MLIPIFVYLWSIYLNSPTVIVGQQHSHSQPFDITIGRDSLDRRFYWTFFLQEESSLTETKEQIFKVWKAFSNTLFSITTVWLKMPIIYPSKSVFKKKRWVLSIQNQLWKRFAMVNQSSSSVFFSLHTHFLVCTLVHQRHVQGIFGPPYPELATLVHSICYHVDIPFINVCFSCYDVESSDENFTNDSTAQKALMSINLYPSNQDLNIAFHNLTHKLHWNRFLIIYDMESGLRRLQKLLNDPGINQTDILVRQFTHYKDRSILIDAIGRDIFHIILDLNDLNTRTILKMALQMGMINSNYHYILTTLVCY